MGPSFSEICVMCYAVQSPIPWCVGQRRVFPRILSTPHGVSDSAASADPDSAMYAVVHYCANISTKTKLFAKPL